VRSPASERDWRVPNEPSHRGDRHHDRFGDPILGNSALDRLANAAHQIIIEGPSYRAKLAPKHRVADTGLVREEVVPAA
jgi:hypothetical protein